AKAPGQAADAAKAAAAGSNAARFAALLTPEKTAPAHVPRFDKPPVIDGQIDEEAWKHAAVLKDFYQTSPGDNIAPSKPTETFMGYDAHNLYIAFHCFDDPDKVRATVAKRDDVLGSEDSIRILLDTFNDQRKAYALFWSPLGVQADGVVTGDGNEDYSPDVVMESKGRVTPDGYTVEVAIPFKSLRYEAGRGKLWGLQVFRIIQRFNGEQDSWMPISRDVSGLLNQEGHITGLEGISTERTLELIPSVTVAETGRRVRRFSRARDGAAGAVDPGRFVNEPVKLDPGLTAKFGITPTVTLDLAVNPDFAQVEADATVNTANQRFPIFFDEKRPFFLEGIEIFRTPLAVVHTRTIVDPDFAAKLTGRRGRNTFGLLVASDNAPGNFLDDQKNDPESLPAAIKRLDDKNSTVAVLRLKRNVGRENSVGFLGTSYNFLGRSNYVGGFDARLRFDKITTTEFQFVGTNAHDCSLGAVKSDDVCQTRNGFGYAYNFDRSARHLSINFNGAGRTQGYVARVGFTRRLNTNNENSNVLYATEPKPKARIVRWVFSNYLGGNFDWQGRMQNYNNEVQVGPNLQRQTFIRVGYNWGYERVFASEFGQTAFANGRSENSVRSRNPFFYAGSTPTKRLNFFYFLAYRWGEHDFDFGNGPRFPRVSPAALIDPNAPLEPGAGNLL
ncbi:MAG: carbohydrate binding family 9 domain-containing protein, partial [Acidobacteriota bacterium]|nr:carbohydrate binding family 9 domain-containing protein [Acidobacteriota bacterium]